MGRRRTIDRLRLHLPAWAVRQLPDARRRVYFRLAVEEQRFDVLPQLIGRADPFTYSALFAGIDHLLTEGEDHLIGRLEPLAEGRNAFERGIYKALRKHASGRTDAACAHLERYGAGERFDGFRRMCARAWSVFLNLPRCSSAGQATKEAPDILQFWDTPEVPADVAKGIATWRSLPGGRHLLFDEHRAREFLHETYGIECARIFDLCPHPAIKSDYFRLGWIASQGGMYVDADEAMLDGFSDIAGQFANRLVLRFYSNQATGHFINGLISAPAGSPTIVAAFEEASRRITKNPDAHVLTLAGPGMLTDVVLSQFKRGVLEDAIVMTNGFVRRKVLVGLDASYKSDERSWHNWQAERKGRSR